MKLPLSLIAAALFASLAIGPAVAEDDGPEAAADEAIAAGSNAAGIIEGMAVKFLPQVKQPIIISESHTDSIWRFVQSTTIEPIIRVAREASEWLVAGTHAAAMAAENTSRWIADRSRCMMSAAGNTGGWIVSSSNAAVVAAQGTGEWIATNSTAAVSQAIDTASAGLGSFTILQNWSADLVKEVENHLRLDPTGEFALLIKESGFALTDIKVGVGIIPELTLEFRHERDLAAAEIQTFKRKVEAYASTALWPVGYFKGHLLRRLVKAGEFSGAMRVSEVHVDVFPLPSLAVLFDPLKYKEEESQKLVDAYDTSQSGADDLKSIKERLAKLETKLSVTQGKE